LPTVTFTYEGGDTDQSTISKTASGITLTLSNPAPFSAFDVDDEGIFVPSTLLSFDLTVTGGTILFKSYLVTYSDQSTATFTMSGGSGTSTGNFFVVATNTANGDWELAPGQTGKFTPSVSQFKAPQLKSWTFAVSA
jgi:hypothetical protein